MPTVKKTVKVSKTVAKRAPVAKKAVAKVAAVKETGLKQSVYDVKGKVAESINLPTEIFGVKINKTLMTQAVRVYLANQRRGTLSTKSRGEVKISTRKIYRQKGTGRARHGAASAPIFVGGGIAFGPKPRDFSLKLNQSMKRVALFSALTSKLKDGEIKIITGLEKIEPKTKKMVDVIQHLELNGKNAQVLLIMPSGNEFTNIVKAGRNIKGVTAMPANLINTYAILSNKRVLFMKDAINSLKETFLK
ncbi:MAG: 50S ribosomal protein L4 [Candidatus Levyibacteriota bacterium]|jgi:large subunit ribosomal protein L4